MLSTYFKNCIMGNVFKTKTSPALPTAMYLGLSTTAPTVSGGNITEPSGGNYSRIKLENMSAPNNGVISNTEMLSFPKSSLDWGKITHYMLFDAATGGNFLISEELSKARTVEDSTIVGFEVGALKFTLADA